MKLVYLIAILNTLIMLINICLAYKSWKSYKVSEKKLDELNKKIKNKEKNGI